MVIQLKFFHFFHDGLNTFTKVFHLQAKVFYKNFYFSTFFARLSYDTRGAHAGTPSHWRDEEVLEDRAVFRTHKEPAELIINPVKVC